MINHDTTFPIFWSKRSAKLTREQLTELAKRAGCSYNPARLGSGFRSDGVRSTGYKE